MSTSQSSGSSACSLGNIQRELQKNGGYILAGLGVSGGLLLLANRNIPSINVPVLGSAADRVAYALRWTGLEGISMVTAAWCVIGVRTKYGSEPTTKEGTLNLQLTSRVLTDTTEAFLTFSAAKLALATVLEANNIRLIPALSGLFILGHYAYHSAIEYPARTFGFTIKSAAIFATYGLFLYKLAKGGLNTNLLSFPLR